MLQIASGKLFTRGIERRNELRGVLYSNLVLTREAPIKTAAGRLLGTGMLRASQAIVYECTELIEAMPDGPGVLISHGMDPYLDDFAAVVSFTLLVTCTPDPELARRLTSGQHGLSVKVAPEKLVKRAFDRQVWCHESDAAQLVAFVRALMGLPRRTFLGVMRAIRTYVTALHRLGDDAELAYTLLVASIESLAQAFDGHRAEWKDFEEEKRKAVDAALDGASAEVADRVRAALLAIEHVSLGRRFRDFTLAHLDQAYFRDEAVGQEHPVGRAELRGALQQAYRLRSRYVHNLDELPKVLTLGHGFAETTRIGRAPVLTFQGLARLARHVITTFLFRQPQLDAEPYDYHLERSNIVHLQMAAEYWVGHTNGVTATQGRRRLEGFFEQLAAYLDGMPNAKITDLRPMLAIVEPMLPTLRAGERRPFLALHFLFNGLVPEHHRTPNPEAVWKRYGSELQAPSVESLLAHLVQRQMPDWRLADHRAVHDEYFRRRDRKNGLMVARSLEMRLTLMLAERCRLEGDTAAARQLITTAVENRPGYAQLRDLETNFTLESPIDWRDELERRTDDKAATEPV